jgi:hypothetical protein
MPKTTSKARYLYTTIEILDIDVTNPFLAGHPHGHGNVSFISMMELTIMPCPRENCDPERHLSDAG